MRRLATTQQTVRCPLDDCSASLTVSTDAGAAPSRRYRDVLGCSLRPPAPYAPPTRIGYFPDLAPPLCFLCPATPGPRHAEEPDCSKACLKILNAAEPGAGGPGSRESGDALELTRHTQTFAVMRLLWTSGI
jgi:hypothetical protein